ncbi:MAG TPA: hypothetical protein VFO79_06700, partial [Xanthomonadales bacterium]|nr:hypothetical protein [Xanthomonadales bacterium]
FTGGEREPHLLAAEQALERVTRGRDAPLVLEVEVIENKTWRGFEAYMAGRDPGRTLHDAVERGQKLHQRAPGHPQVGPALGMAAWTLADYQRLIGEDAEAMARVAVDAYGRTIARESASFADRFNAVGALQLLARERLARGRSAAAELEELARWTALLQARAGGENRIDIQLAANQHLAALQALHESRDAREALAAARRGLERALANPLDAREAALLLAELVAAEHASRRARMEPDDARARADAQALREAVARHADYAALHAAIAEAYVALPAGIVAPAEARELLESALERMPPLRGRYAELARALAAR